MSPGMLVFSCLALRKQEVIEEEIQLILKGTKLGEEEQEKSQGGGKVCFRKKIKIHAKRC